MSEHTPLPWRVTPCGSGSILIDRDDEESRRIGMTECICDFPEGTNQDRADADFIVKAVNSYDKMQQHILKLYEENVALNKLQSELINGLSELAAQYEKLLLAHKMPRETPMGDSVAWRKLDDAMALIARTGEQ